MKKVYTYIFLAVVAVFGFSACNNLDLEPKGILDEGTLFNSEFGVKKYLAGLYNDLPIEDFLYKASNDGPIGYGTSNS
ncbi:MAG: RagB/SusD family nutrient uptake outer membrane protein, partial [Bacteroidales bacterium]|nr:RagB/SusD family nutrient uptake outer membrane protein [Bacteroidales bacterium]